MCVAIWRGDASWPRFERQRAGLATVVARNPRGAVFLCVIEAASKAPSEDLRRAAIEMVSSHGPALKGVACAIEATGFMAAITRGVLTGMGLLLPSRVMPGSYFENVHAAAHWLRAYAPISSASNVTSSIEGFRSQLPPRAMPPQT
jgi:hypothetical protein